MEEVFDFKAQELLENGCGGGRSVIRQTRESLESPLEAGVCKCLSSTSLSYFYSFPGTIRGKLFWREDTISGGEKKCFSVLFNPLICFLIGQLENGTKTGLVKPQ
jgi:hypothetical protein